MPPVLNVPAAAELLGVGRTAAYAAIRAGTWATPVLRLGRLVRIPSAPLLELLGLQLDHNGRAIPRTPPGYGDAPATRAS